MNAKDLYDEIVEIIDERITYLKHYTGEIILVEEFQAGTKKVVRAKCLVYELGLRTPDLAIWCMPRQTRSQVYPQIGELVEIYFLNGKPDQPVYLYPLSHIYNQGFENTGFNKDIIYESNDGQGIITFDKTSQTLQTSANTTRITASIPAAASLEIFGNSKTFVTHQELATALTSWYNSSFLIHTHVFTGIGSVGVPNPGTNDYDITLAEATQVKTGSV